MIYFKHLHICKRLKILSVTAFLLLALLCSCREDITLGIPPYETKLAVHCILQPGVRPVLFLNRSKGYFEYTDTSTDINYIDDATVILTDVTAGWIDTLKSAFMTFGGGSTHGYYFCDKQIISGHTYKLNVWHKGRHVSAETTVPDPVVIKNVTFTADSSNYIDPLYQMKYIFNIEFEDIAGQQNAYKIISNTRNAITSWHEDERNKKYLYDYGNDGATLTYNYYQWVYFKPADMVYARFIVENSTAATAEYTQALINQVNSRDENEFFAEPVILKHNINGGLGIFGAKSISQPFSVRIR